MATITELELPGFEYNDASLKGPRFHEAMRELRETNWVARADPIGDVVLDQEATAFFLRSKSVEFPGRKILEAQGVTEGPLYERLKGNLLDLRGDEHKRMRKLVQPSFTPAEADKLRPAMRERLEELWDAVGVEGRCDFVRSFATPFPALMIAAVMGSPPEDAERLGRWANTIQSQFDPIKVANELPRLEKGSQEFVEYTRELLHRRKD